MAIRAMFERMLDHPNIEMHARAPTTARVADRFPTGELIFTGPIDEYFGYRLRAAALPLAAVPARDARPRRLQPVAWSTTRTTKDYTRVTEYKHLTGQAHPKTSHRRYEYPQAEGDPYYPVPRPENAALYKRYKALADDRRGRLVRRPARPPTYYNMDQVVGQALATFARISAQLGEKPRRAGSLPPDEMRRQPGRGA